MTLQQLNRDLRLAARSLRRAPGYTVAAVLILGLGIGLSTAMFTVYRSVLVRRLPVSDQNRLAVLHPLDRGGTHLDVPAPYLDELRRDSRTLRSVAGVYHLGAVPSPLTGGRSDDASLNLYSARVTANFFDVMGSRALLGRMLQPADGAAGAAQVIVLAYDAWHRLFNEDSSIVGRSFIVPYDHTNVTIVGVAPPGLEYPAGADAWWPIQPDFTAQVDIVARLASGTTLDAARSELLAMAQRRSPFASVPADANFRPPIAGVEAHSFIQDALGSVRPALVVLTAAVALLLLIACVNVGNLVLIRGSARAREMAIRRALGAGFGDLARQLLVENSILGLAGGVVGLLCAQAFLRLLVAFAPSQLPRVDVIRLEGAPLGSAVAVTFVAVLLFGLAPSLAAARTDPNASLRLEARSFSAGVSRRRLRQWLVASQVALALIMLSGAALLARSLDRLERLDLGYRPEHLSLLSFTASKSLCPTPERCAAAADRLKDRLRAVPGVVSLSAVESPPFRGQSLFITKMAREELTGADAEATPYVPFEVADEDYFRTFQIPIVRGRGFLASDTKGSSPVVVLSEALAARLWPGQDAVGKRLHSPYDSSGAMWTVVGVAHDTHFRTLRDAAPVIYTGWHQQAYTTWWGYFAVRTSGSLASALPSIRRAVSEVDPGLIILKAQTMDQLLAGPLGQPRLNAFLLSSFGAIALLLAAIGLYGVMSFAVRQQTREIGIRMALGATTGRVRRRVLGEALTVVGAGAVVGLVGALVSMRLLSTQLFGVSPSDPVSIAGACVVLLGVGLGAAYVPARYATKVDPASALREE